MSNENKLSTAPAGAVAQKTAGGGALSVFTDGASFNTALRMAQCLASSTVVPKEYHGNVGNCMIAIEMASRINTSPMMLELIQGGEEKESDIIARMNSAKLVIFDDLGAERNTDYALEKIYNIIDSRYRRKLPMLLTTNLTIDEMKDEEDRRYSRIYDRIFETCYSMQFTGPSWRKKEASRRFTEMEKLFDID